jgi:glycosyltransferase involved in cell wall biosynthesis
MYFRQPENIGANENFNFCLKQASGDYFSLLHDDDLLDGDFVETCLQAVDHNRDLGIVRTGIRVIDAQGVVLREITNDVVGLPTDKFFRAWFAGRTTIYFCNTLFNTERLRGAGGFTSPRLVFQDAFAIVRLAAESGRADVREVKASFRRHAGGRTFSTRIHDWCEDSLALLDLMCRFVADSSGSFRQEGYRFFRVLNYMRACEAPTPLSRLFGIVAVFKRFGYRQLPPRGVLYRTLEGTALYSAARMVKRALRQQFSAG